MGKPRGNRTNGKDAGNPEAIENVEEIYREGVPVKIRFGAGEKKEWFAFHIAHHIKIDRGAKHPHELPIEVVHSRALGSIVQ